MTVVKLFPDHRHGPILQVFVEAHHPVYDPGRRDLNDSIRHRGDELMVAGGKKDHLREGVRFP